MQAPLRGGGAGARQQPAIVVDGDQVLRPHLVVGQGTGRDQQAAGKAEGEIASRTTVETGGMEPLRPGQQRLPGLLLLGPRPVVDHRTGQGVSPHATGGPSVQAAGSGGDG